MKKKVGIFTILCLFPSLLLCSPSGEEPVEVLLEVASSRKGIDVCTNDMGWTVEVTAFRLAIRDLEFTIEGETHADLSRDIFNLFASKAFAHGGHYAGGDVTGELTGKFIVDVMDDGQELGEASVLVGDYHGVNFTFRTASERDDLDADDPLLGNTAVIEGVATRESDRVEFTARLKADDDVQMVGGPFELNVEEDSSETLLLQVFTIDPSEDDTLFDGIDFSELADGDEGHVEINPGDSAHNILIKTLMRHDHYGIRVE